MKTEFEKWNPLVEIPSSVSVERLIDDSDGFKIYLYDANVDIENIETIFLIEFDFYFGYRNLDESYHLNTWRELPFPTDTWSLFRTTRGDFVRSFNELTLNIHKDKVVNYMICTSNDVVEILTSRDVDITVTKEHYVKAK